MIFKNRVYVKNATIAAFFKYSKEPGASIPTDKKTLFDYTINDVGTYMKNQ